MTFTCKYCKNVFVRSASLFLALLFIALGSGAIEYVHNRAHVIADSLEDRAAMFNLLRSHHIAGVADVRIPIGHHHDDSNCATHAQLHLPIIGGQVIAGLVCLGLLIAQLAPHSNGLFEQLLSTHHDCRGPPLAAS